jgi:hypothetical protein
MAKTADPQGYKRTHVDEPLAQLAAIRQKALDRMNARPAGPQKRAAGTEPQPALKRPVFTRS